MSNFSAILMEYESLVPGGGRHILLTRGLFALVLHEHYADLIRFKWYAKWDHGVGYYAVRSFRINGKRMSEKMHRRILGLKPGDGVVTDHANHDTLDNRPPNICAVTNRQNHENRLKQSKYGVGVYLKPRHKSKPFEAQAWFDGKIRSLGYFKTAAGASAYRDMVIRERAHTIAVSPPRILYSQTTNAAKTL